MLETSASGVGLPNHVTLIVIDAYCYFTAFKIVLKPDVLQIGEFQLITHTY